MFNINRHLQFKTAGELKECLKNIPDNTEVTVCGNNDCFYHEDWDKRRVCLDCENLEDCYDGQAAAVKTNGQ